MIENLMQHVLLQFSRNSGSTKTIQWGVQTVLRFFVSMKSLRQHQKLHLDKFVEKKHLAKHFVMY